MIARVLALGMKKHSLRLSVRDAMRASLVTEHKLGFQDFVRTPTGKDLLIEGSSRLGITMDSVDRIVAEVLPQWPADCLVFIR